MQSSLMAMVRFLMTKQVMRKQFRLRTIKMKLFGQEETGSRAISCKTLLNAVETTLFAGSNQVQARSLSLVLGSGSFRIICTQIVIFNRRCKCVVAFNLPSREHNHNFFRLPMANAMSPHV